METEAQRRDLPGAVFFVPPHPTPNSKVPEATDPGELGERSEKVLRAPKISSGLLRAEQEAREPSEG